MAITSYSELVTAVGNWMARSDLNDRIPEFIALAEAKFNRNLFMRQMEQRSTASVDVSSDEPEFISLPDNFQSMRRLYLPGVSGKPKLQYLTPDQLYEHDTFSTGQPCFYTLIGDEIELLPIPDGNYELAMVYRKAIPALSDSSTTNWLLTLAPDAYLYGALSEAAMFMQEDERVPLWQANLKGAVDALNDLSFSVNSSPMQMRTYGPTP